MIFSHSLVVPSISPPWTYKADTGKWPWMKNPNQTQRLNALKDCSSLMSCHSGYATHQPSSKILMAVVLQELEEFTTAHLDDEIIRSNDARQHSKHLQQVFDRLLQHGLKLKLKKCSFYQNKTNYLGFIISDKGIQPDPEKVRVIKALPQPTWLCPDVRSFVGMTGYYRHVIPQYS